MAQFSVEITRLPGSVLSGNQHIESAGFGLPEPTYRVRLVRGGASVPEAEGPLPPTKAQPLNEIMPDETIDQLVAASQHEGEPNLLSRSAPQE